MKKIGLMVAATSLLSACQTMPYQPYARSVKVKPSQGGVIALNLDHRDEDRLKADTLMSRTCGNKGIKILEEGEVAIGTTTKAKAKKSNYRETNVGSLFGIPMSSSDNGQNTNSTTTTTEEKEWRISYKCTKSKKG